MHQPILKKLRAYRSHIRACLAAEGLSQAALVVVGLVFFSLFIDYHQRMGLAGRVLSLVVGLGIIGFALRRQLHSKLVRPMDYERIALTAEERFPELRDRVISALQFAGALDAESSGRSDQSLAMMSAVTSEAAAVMAPLDLGRTVDHNRLLRAVGLAAAACAALIAFTAAYPATMRLWFQRNILLMNVAWPQRTHLDVEYDNLVPEGDPLTVQITASGEIPSTVAIEYDFLESRRRGSEDLAPLGGIGDSKFRARLKNVTGPLKFRVSGGDARTEWLGVRMVKRPTITQLKFWAVYPSYTRLPPEVFAVPQSTVRVLPGTKLWFAIGVSKRLAKDETLKHHGAWFVMDDENDRMRMTHVTAMESDDPKLAISSWLTPKEQQTCKEVWVGSLVVAGPTSISVHVVDTKGLRNRPPTRFSVEVAADREPTVTLVRKGIGDMITPDATIPLRVKATDDFGVQDLWIRHKVVTGEKEYGEEVKLVPRKKLKAGAVGVGYVTLKEARKAEQHYATGRASYDRKDYAAAEAALTLAVRTDPRHAKARGLLKAAWKALGKRAVRIARREVPLWRWPLKRYGLQAGSVFVFRAEATDYKDVEPKNVGKTENVSLRVVTPDELMADLVRRQIEQRQDFERVFDRQYTEIKIEIDAAQIIIHSKGALTKVQKERLAAVEETVRHSAEEVKHIGDKLEQVLLEMINNKLGDKREKSRLRDGIVLPLRRLSGALMPELAGGLQSAKAAGKAELKNLVKSLVEQDNRILNEMKLVRDNMLDLESYRRMVDDTKKIRRDQEKILQDIKKELEKLFPK